MIFAARAAELNCKVLIMAAAVPASDLNSTIDPINELLNIIGIVRYTPIIGAITAHG